MTFSTPGFYSVIANFSGFSFLGTFGTDSVVIDVEPSQGNVSVVVYGPIGVTAAFSPGLIVSGQTSTLTVTLSNSNEPGLQNASFTGSLSSGLTVAATPALANTCGGIATATAGATAFKLNTGSVIPGTPCTVSFSVTGSTVGSYSASTGAVSASPGTSAGSVSASLGIVSAAPVTAAFSPTLTAVGAPSTLTLSIANASTNASAMSAVAFTDALPTGLTIAATPALTNSCGGTATATAGSSSLALSGGGVSLGSSCTLTVAVVASVAGAYTESTTVSSPPYGNLPVASAALVADGPAGVAAAFSPNVLGTGQTSALTITLSNASANGAQTSLAFTDNLPSGLTIASTPALANTCGGTATAIGGSSSLALTGGALASGASCTVTVSVLASASGTYNDSTGTVSISPGGTTAAATATLSVDGPAGVAAAFSPTVIGTGQNSVLTLTLSNASSNGAQTALTFTDTLPSGLTIAATPALANTCGGTLSAAGSTLSLTGGSLASGASCTVTVSVLAGTSGTYNDSTGTVTISPGGNSAAATATLTVDSPVAVAAAFSPTAIGLGQTSVLTITLSSASSNGSQTALTFTDTLPSGLTIAATPALADTCGGTAAATGGGNSLALTGGALANGASCTVTVSVLAGTPGAYTDSTGTVTISPGGNSAAATATLTVDGPVAVAAAFSPTVIGLGGTSVLTITLSNPSPNGAQTALAFTDAITDLIQVAAAPNLTNTCGGTATAIASSNSLALTGGALAGGASCTVTVSVFSEVQGVVTNSTGIVSISPGGNATPATAILDVAFPAAVTVAFSPSTIMAGQTSTLTITLSNAANVGAQTALKFTDSFPSGVTVAATPALTNTCGGTATATGGGSSLVLTGGALAGGASCAVTVSVSAVVGTHTDSTGVVTITPGGQVAAATASLTVSLATPIVSVSSVSAPYGSITGVLITATESGGAGSVNGDHVTFSTANGATGSFSPNPCSLGTTGVCTTTFTPTGTLTGGTYINGIQAVFSANSNYAAATATSNLTIAQQPQTITFVPPAAEALASTQALLVATASSGLPITFSVTSGAATILGNTITFTGSGPVVIAANQPGNAAYTAAPTVSYPVTVISDYVWLVNNDATVSRVSAAGAALASIGSPTGNSAQGGIAFDASGNAWSATLSANQLSRSSATAGTTNPISGGGIANPSALAVDGAGFIWVANVGNNSLSLFNNAGTPLTAASDYLNGILNNPSAILIDSTGGIWVTNKSGRSVTHVFGAAAPVATPLSQAVTNSTLGTKP